MKQSTTLGQHQLLRQRLLPQQLRLVGLVEKTDEEVEEEIARELAENPALERVGVPAISASAAAATERPETADFDETLAEALRGQLAEQTELQPQVRRLTDYMIGALDNNGYLTRTLPQLRTDIELEGEQFTDSELRAAYNTLRSLDPAGVGAQDLRDTLLLQLKRMNPERREVGDAMEIIRHFFDVYSRRNFKKLVELTGLNAERVERADELVRTLNPKPGAPYASDPAQALARSAVQPDFIVETDGRRAWVSLPNSLPELRIEQSFTIDPENPEAAKFVKDRRAQASGFIDALKRRQETLLAIGRAIVELQAPFFTSADDDRKIRPMVLRQISEATGLDLSLISRAVAGKWLATQWGVYPLKSFFNHRSGAADDSTSAREIEAAIRELVDAEQQPLTDDALAEELTKRGYSVARRTVAKYRTRLGILPARMRRSKQ